MKVKSRKHRTLKVDQIFKTSNKGGILIRVLVSFYSPERQLTIFTRENITVEMVCYFIGVYIINRTLHGRLEIRNVSSRVEKYFTRSLYSVGKYFQHSKRNFVSPRNILYLLFQIYIQYYLPVGSA